MGSKHEHTPAQPRASPSGPLLGLQRHSLHDHLPDWVRGVALGSTHEQGPVSLPTVLCLQHLGVEVATHPYRVLHQREEAGH